MPSTHAAPVNSLVRLSATLLEHGGLSLTARAMIPPAVVSERGPRMLEVIGAILLVLGIILAAVLAIAVTRWALHM